ncbi:MAG: TonB-dependent receptor [Acidimicrobiales bacterium]|nr:TonB-dependent receptor [Hyphomonadaceae bacterium]RZV42122.1 MAG: TonB-dependent receptor [Acidimicrobiales bacterium]
MKLTTPFSAAITGLLFSTSTFAFAQEQFDEIIVTGSILSNSVDEAITGVSVLSDDDLLKRLAPTLGETLKTEPGVSSTAFGAGASRPIIRGQGGDRVRVLTNGIGSIDASSASPDHAVAAEPAQAERIEVLRGASLLRYGSSGSGGIINVIDGRIPGQIPEDKLDGAIRIGASSVDQGREVSGALDYGIGDSVVLHLDSTYKETDDYNIPGFAESERLRAEEEEEGNAPEQEAFGRLDNSDVSTSSQSVGLSYIGENGFIGVAVHNFNSDYGVPGGHGHEEEHDEDHEDEEEEEEGGVTIGLDQTRIDLNGEVELNGFIEKLQIFGGYADYKHTEFEAPGEPGTVFTNEGYEVRAEAIQAEKNGWAGAYGAQIRSRDFAAIGDEAFVPPTNTRQIGLYTFQAKEIGDLHLEVGARYENVKQENAQAGTDRKFDLWSVSGGGDVHLTDTIRLGGTVFRTERAPTTEELYSDGPHLATNQFERGDSSLGKEIATGIEAAFRHRTDTHFITANIFYTDYSNYISDRGTAETEDELPVFQFVGEDATFKGFEIQAGHDVATLGSFDVKVDGLAEYVRAETDSGNLPRIPPLSILTGIEADSDRLNLRAELDYTSAQNDISVFETPSEDYALVNVFATWKADLAQEVQISLSVQNLFDEEARQHTSFLKELVPLPGRNIRFSLSSRF